MQGQENCSDSADLLQTTERGARRACDGAQGRRPGCEERKGTAHQPCTKLQPVPAGGSRSCHGQELTALNIYPMVYSLWQQEKSSPVYPQLSRSTEKKPSKCLLMHSNKSDECFAQIETFLKATCLSPADESLKQNTVSSIF